MPYLGLLDNTEVIPPQVADGATVECPACSGSMAVVQSHKRGNAFISRHFRHHDRNQNPSMKRTGQTTLTELTTPDVCPGESDEHQKMKSIAFARLEHDFPDATVKLEAAVENHIADVLLKFDTPCSPYGRGIAVEAQYRNHGKDIEAVTEHYLEHGFSVAWLEEDDFTPHDVDLSSILTVWPYALPDRVGTEGYPDVIQWLWEEKSTEVEIELPIPAEYWSSFDKSDEWITVAQCRLRRRGRAWTTISRSPTGHLTLQLGKKEFGWNADSHRVTVQLERGDCKELQEFVTDLRNRGFGTARPTEDERNHPWHDLTTAWLAGSPNVTTWLSASLSPDGDVVLSLGKKHPMDSERVSVQIDETAVNALRRLIKLLERAFELESE